MNEILQKRIEEAAFTESYMYETIQEKNAAYNTAMKVAKFALQNQWISVEERLPKNKEDVFVRNEYGGCTAAWYSRNTKDWHLTCGEICGDDIISSKITHWMEIPSLEGGEQ